MLSTDSTTSSNGGMRAIAALKIRILISVLYIVAQDNGDSIL